MGEIGKLITSGARFINSIAKNEPKAIPNFMQEVIESTEKKELEKALGYLISSFVGALLANPELLASAVTPFIQSLKPFLKKMEEER